MKKELLFIILIISSLNFINGQENIGDMEKIINRRFIEFSIGGGLIHGFDYFSIARNYQLPIGSILILQKITIIL